MSAVRTIYVHGLPGSSAAEMAIAFRSHHAVPHFECLDRLPFLGEDCDYEAAILKAFDALPHIDRGAPIRLIGFSLGAMATLHIAAARPDLVSSLELIAPAAPLQLGDFLGAMAGKSVFALAIAGRRRLNAFTHLQSIGVQLAPNLIVRQLFKTAPMVEQDMMAQAGNRSAFIQGTGYAVRNHRAGYCRELLSYVEDWSHVVAQVRQPVRIWQGMDDNWVPPQMAKALAASLDTQISFEPLRGLSHYGALAHTLPLLLSNGR